MGHFPLLFDMSAARRLIQFIDASPSPYHAVKESVKMLEGAGFQCLRETDSWVERVQRGGKYYVTRNQSSLFAFVVPPSYEVGDGFNIIGAHTDSPCLRLRPNTKKEGKGLQQVGVQTYGGGLWHTWFDRDLALAGRVIVQQEDETYRHELVFIDKPILRIPNLCIHLREDRDTFKPNAEKELVPILASGVNATKAYGESTNENHHAALLSLISEEAKCPVDKIKDFELCLCDHQKSAVGGALEEFIFAPRLDNLFSSFCAITALIEQSTEDSLKEESNIRVAALFDHEEIGSSSCHGADSNYVEHVFHRILVSLHRNDLGDLLEKSFRRSFLVSADMAHAVHPCYAEKHQDQHGPEMHKGPVIKTNDNQRYATSAWTGFLIRELALKNNIPIQEFVVRNDSRCGSTIGPILATRGIRTMDIGAPQLSMHSIREMCGTEDVEHSLRLFSAFYGQFTKLDRSLLVD